MKRKIRFVMIILLILFVFSASCAEESFSFRNGIQFNMTSKELMQKEKENGQIDEKEWQNIEMGNWIGLVPTKKIPVSQYETILYYMLSDDHMQAVVYGFYEDTSVPTETKYRYLSYALSTVYGEVDTVSASEVVSFMDTFVQGFYHESDIKEAVKWTKSDVVIYQFYYSEENFVILYSNPNFDYSSVNRSLVNVNGL